MYVNINMKEECGLKKSYMGAPKRKFTHTLTNTHTNIHK